MEEQKQHSKTSYGIGGGTEPTVADEDRSLSATLSLLMWAPLENAGVWISLGRIQCQTDTNICFLRFVNFPNLV